jgi:cytochrome c
MIYLVLMRVLKFKLSFAIGWMAFTCCLITSFLNPRTQLENVPPEVVIIKPPQNEVFFWNTIMQYKISITDKEDGKSEYDEINAREVLLEVCYLPDTASAKIYTDKKRNGKENSGLTIIRKSDCFTCHASKSKLIGPSFELIAKRYGITNSSVERLTKNIVNGSTGIWGKTAMAAHKDLNVTDVRQMVKWILSNGANYNTTFYPGVEGAFKTENKPVNGSAKMVMVLTASYTDHGDKNSMQNNKYGQYTVSLKPAN